MFYSTPLPNWFEHIKLSIVEYSKHLISIFRAQGTYQFLPIEVHGEGQKNTSIVDYYRNLWVCCISKLLNKAKYFLWVKRLMPSDVTRHWSKHAALNFQILLWRNWQLIIIRIYDSISDHCTDHINFPKQILIITLENFQNIQPLGFNSSRHLHKHWPRKNY